MKRKFKILLFLCLLMICAPLKVDALDNIDTTKKTSLTVSFVYGETTPVPGATFRLYKIAKVENTNNSVYYTPTFEFGDYIGANQINNVDSDTYRDDAETLSSAIAANNISCLATAQTDEEGNVTFTKSDTGIALEPGMYLVIGESKQIGNVIYTPESFLVALPNLENSAWKYEVKANCKNIARTYDPETTISVTVLKNWDDKGYEDKRPSEITVHLFEDGKDIGTQILDDSNGWKWSWKNLDSTKDYQVYENPISGYNAPVITAEDETEDGNLIFTITNTYNKPEGTPTPSPTATPTPATDSPEPSNSPTPNAGETTPCPDCVVTPSSETTDCPDCVVETPTATSSTWEELPFTGIVWWPVPVLAIAGVVLCIIGYKQGHKHD